MKLLRKTNRYFVLVSLVVFAVGGLFFLLLFKGIIDRDLTNKLYARKNYITKQAADADSTMLHQGFSANTLSAKRVSASATRQEVIADTVIFDEVEGKPISYRQLSFVADVQGTPYRISIRRAYVETKDLVTGVIILEASLFLAFAAILALLNNQLSKQLWKPFYAMLETISHYKPERAESLHFEKSSITEFNELAEAIEMMSGKINQEFMAQKEFTENASHEIQTPLTIVRNKLEVLLQTPGLNEHQMGLINSATNATNRLSKLNEALIILSRIENRQFHVVENIHLNNLIDRHLTNLEELIRIKGITVRKVYHEFMEITMNPFLADMLIENLIVNAIKHNKSPGFMSISVEFQNLRISNTGEDARISPERIFGRFVRRDTSGSPGLGLAIVKAICDTYLLPIEYAYDNRIHEVKLELRQLRKAS